MRFYQGQHTHYCGVDLHTKTMFLCVLDQQGDVLLERNTRSNPKSFLKAIAPFREGLVVACECIFTWYWLADLCEREGIAFVLGHALYMKAIHGGKAKNDRLDANKIAVLLRGGTLPQAGRSYRLCLYLFVAAANLSSKRRRELCINPYCGHAARTGWSRRLLA